jgi:xanthine dehydrogenase accessory factor
VSGPEVPPSAAQREWAHTSDLHGPQFALDGGPGTPRMIIFGAVTLAAALCRAARTVGWIPYVVDPRERFATTQRFPDAEQVLVAWPAAALAQLGGLDADTAVVALAHAPELDDGALVSALGSPAFYVGAMGSRRTQARRRERLAATGLSDAELARLAGPAGLDLGGETASQAALAILAEAVATRHGRPGGPLTDSGNAIHVGGRP